MPWAAPQWNARGFWQWHYELPNGWTAAVIDGSQAATPPRATEHHTGAFSAHHEVKGQTFGDFFDARRAALDLAMAQADNGELAEAA